MSLSPRRSRRNANWRNGEPVFLKSLFLLAFTQISPMVGIVMSKYHLEHVVLICPPTKPS